MSSGSREKLIELEHQIEDDVSSDLLLTSEQRTSKRSKWTSGPQIVEMSKMTSEKARTGESEDWQGARASERVAKKCVRDTKLPEDWD